MNSFGYPTILLMALSRVESSRDIRYDKSGGGRRTRLVHYLIGIDSRSCPWRQHAHYICNGSAPARRGKGSAAAKCLGTSAGRSVCRYLHPRSAGEKGTIFRKVGPRAVRVHCSHAPRVKLWAIIGNSVITGSKN